MLLTPEVGNAMQQVGAKIRFAAALTARERELGILTVAGELRSDFERLAHEPAARKLGLTQAQVNAVLSGRVPDGLTERRGTGLPPRPGDGRRSGPCPTRTTRPASPGSAGNASPN